MKHRKAEEWLQNNATMYRGNNASDCMLSAYAAGADEAINSIKFELLPACIDALSSVNKCLSSDGNRCAPNMSDFVKVENALEIIDDIIKRGINESV